MASSQEDGQESMENSPKNKPECSFLQQDCNFEENPELGSAPMVGVGAISEGNQEMIDSLTGNVSFPASLAGKCENSGEMLIDTDAELSPAKEAQEIGEADPLKKLESSVLQPDCEIEANQEMGFASGVGFGAVSVGNQEKIDYFGEKGSFSASSPGFSDPKDTGLVVSSENEGQETMETSKNDSDLQPDQELGFGTDSGIDSVSEGNQEMANSSGENASLSGFSAAKVETVGNPAHGADANQVGFADDVKNEMGILELEAEKKPLMAELEVGTLFRVGEKGIDAGKVLVNSSLKIEVIDDTALIETFPVRKTEIVGVKKMGVGVAAAAKIAEKNSKQEFYDKKAKPLHRKPVYVKKVSQSAGVGNGKGKNVEPTKTKYSREEMEALRFINIVEQRKLWRDVHTGLGAAVMREYHDLAAISKQQTSGNVNVDPHQQFRRVEGAPGVLGVFNARGPRNDLNIFVPGGMARCNLQRTNCNQMITAFPYFS